MQAATPVPAPYAQFTWTTAPPEDTDESAWDDNIMWMLPDKQRHRTEREKPSRGEQQQPQSWADFAAFSNRSNDDAKVSRDEDRSPKSMSSSSNACIALMASKKDSHSRHKRTTLVTPGSETSSGHISIALMATNRSSSSSSSNNNNNSRAAASLLESASPTALLDGLPSDPLKLERHNLITPNTSFSSSDVPVTPDGRFLMDSHENNESYTSLLGLNVLDDVCLPPPVASDPRKRHLRRLSAPQPASPNHTGVVISNEEWATRRQMRHDFWKRRQRSSDEQEVVAPKQGPRSRVVELVDDYDEFEDMGYPQEEDWELESIHSDRARRPPRRRINLEVWQHRLSSILVRPSVVFLHRVRPSLRRRTPRVARPPLMDNDDLVRINRTHSNDSTNYWSSGTAVESDRVPSERNWGCRKHKPEDGEWGLQPAWEEDEDETFDRSTPANHHHHMSIWGQEECNVVPATDAQQQLWYRSDDDEVESGADLSIHSLSDISSLSSNSDRCRRGEQR